MSVVHARRLVAGLLLLATVAVIVMVVRSAEPRPQQITVVFESAQGLIAGGHVRAGGLRIGTISDIALAEDGFPHVTLDIDPGYEVRRGATATIRMPSQAGQLNRFVSIDNGTGVPLADGSRIGRGSSDEPVEFDELLSVLTPDVRTQVRGIVGDSHAALAGRGEDLAATIEAAGDGLDEVAKLAAEVNADRAALRSLVTVSAAGAERVAAERDALGRAVDQTATLLDTAAARRTEVDTLLRTAPAAFAGVRPALRRLPEELPQLMRTMRTLDRQTRGLGATARELQRTSATLPATLDAFLRLAPQTQRQAPVLESLLEQATPATSAAADALKGANPILDVARARFPDLLGWMITVGNSARRYDGAGHGIRAAGILPEVPRRFTTGSDDCSGGLLRRPFDRIPGQLACDPWHDFASSFVGGGVDPRTLVRPEDTASQDTDLP